MAVALIITGPSTSGTEMMFFKVLECFALERVLAQWDVLFEEVGVNVESTAYHRWP